MRQKTKNRLLVVGFFVMLVITYQLAISKTFQAKYEISRVENEKMGTVDMVRLNLNLNQREKYLDSLLNNYNFQGLSVQSSLLNFLNSQSENEQLSISGFREPHIMRDNNGVSITSYQFIIKGEYKQIEQVLYLLEKEFRFGSIAYVNFEKKRDNRKRLEYLETEVIIVGYKNN